MPELKTTPTVSVIIPVWNGSERLKLCLEALSAQTLPADDFEIIVVDNGSSDTSYEVACSFAGVIALREASPGSYSARNHGLSVARGQYLAFTDADCVPAPEWLEQALEIAQRDPRIGIVAGHIALFSEDEEIQSVCVDYEDTFSFNQQSSAAAGACATANWLSPRAAVEDGGRFDGSLRSGGDFVLSKRISSRGWRVVYSPESIVGHPVRGTVAELSSKRRRIIGGQWSDSTGPLRFAKVSLGSVLNFARKTRSVLRENKLSRGRKLGVLGVVVQQLASEQSEVLRLMLGGEPRR